MNLTVFVLNTIVMNFTKACSKFDCDIVVILIACIVNFTVLVLNTIAINFTKTRSKFDYV